MLALEPSRDGSWDQLPGPEMHTGPACTLRMLFMGFLGQGTRWKRSLGSLVSMGSLTHGL